MSVFTLTFSHTTFESVHASPAYALRRQQTSRNLSSTSSWCQPQRSYQKYLAYAERSRVVMSNDNQPPVEQLSWRIKRVITVNRPDMHSDIAWWRAGQCVTLCQVLSHWGCSFGAEESGWLDSELSRESAIVLRGNTVFGTVQQMLFKAWTGQLLLSAVAGPPDVLLADR